MIQATNVVKCFGKTHALDGLSCHIADGCVYGLVGSNGAGKSTFLRLISGIYRADSGSVLYDGRPVFDNPETKKKIVFIADELYFAAQSSMNDMAALYGAIYEDFDKRRFQSLTEVFRLNPRVGLNTFSKGMRRQAAMILGLSARPKYLFFDETFDGLDPIMRNLVKKVIYNDAAENGTTIIISSHSLRELEDTCDQLALLHRGGIVLESDVQNLKTSLYKVQIAFSEPFNRQKLDGAGLDILSYTQHGSVAVCIARGDKEAAIEKLGAMKPLLLDSLPLNLEEVFIYELAARGYSFEDVLV